MKLINNRFKDIRDIELFSKEDIYGIKSQLTIYQSEYADTLQVNNYLKQLLYSEILDFFSYYLKKIRELFDKYIVPTEVTKSINILSFQGLKSGIFKELNYIIVNLKSVNLNANNIRRFFKKNSYLEDLIEKNNFLLDEANKLVIDFEVHVEKIANIYDNDVYLWFQINQIKNLWFVLNPIPDSIEVWEETKELINFIENLNEELKKKKKKDDHRHVIHFEEVYRFCIEKQENQILYPELLYLLYLNNIFEEYAEQDIEDDIDKDIKNTSLGETISPVIIKIFKVLLREILDHVVEVNPNYNLREDLKRLDGKGFIEQKLNNFLPRLLENYLKALDKKYQDIIDSRSEDDDSQDIIDLYSGKIDKFITKLLEFTSYLSNIETFLGSYDMVTSSLKQIITIVVDEINRKKNEFLSYLTTIKTEKNREDVRNFISFKISELSDLINKYEEETSVIIKGEFPQLENLRKISENYKGKIQNIKTEVNTQLELYRDKNIDLYQTITQWEENFNRKSQQLNFLVSLLIKRIIKSFQGLIEKEGPLLEGIDAIAQQGGNEESLSIDLKYANVIADELSMEQINARINEINSKIDSIKNDIVMYEYERKKFEDQLKKREKLSKGLDITEAKCSVCFKDIDFSIDQVIKCAHCGGSFHYLCVAFWLSKYNSCPTCQNCFVVPDSGLFDSDDNRL